MTDPSSGQPKEPVDEPDLASQDRFSYMSRLIRIEPELERTVEVAKGNLTARDVRDTWLEPLARKRRESLPSESLQRWYALFSDEIATVFRAINTIRSDAYISAGNAAAAVQIADKLLNLAQEAAAMDRG